MKNKKYYIIYGIIWAAVLGAMAGYPYLTSYIGNLMSRTYMTSYAIIVYIFEFCTAVLAGLLSFFAWKLSVKVRCAAQAVLIVCMIFMIAQNYVRTFYLMLFGYFICNLIVFIISGLYSLKKDKKKN